MDNSLEIIPIPAFDDNYIWLLHDGQDAIIVDPGDATPVLKTLKKLNLNLNTILITHHHDDHIGGVDALQAQFPNVNTFAPQAEQYNFKHTPVSAPKMVSIKKRIAEQNLSFEVIDLPGHTLGHVAYFAYFKQQPLLFCGDTLFAAGCGRLFEGSPAQMLASLQKLKALPRQTAIYCTHEYTEKNIAFALTIEPNNPALIERQKNTASLRAENKPSLPTTLELELETNPFLRCHEMEIKKMIGLDTGSELATFTEIRLRRNHY